MLIKFEARVHDYTQVSHMGLDCKRGEESSDVKCWVWGAKEYNFCFIVIEHKVII